MFNLLNFTPREYQESIFQSAKEKNTLVVLPTGIGKTAIALLLILERLNKFPDSKVVFCSPTKPLCNQHYETIKNNTNIEKEKITLYTGNLSPKTRKELFESSKVIIATPQTIQSDLENKRIEFAFPEMVCILQQALCSWKCEDYTARTQDYLARRKRRQTRFHSL